MAGVLPLLSSFSMECLVPPVAGHGDRALLLVGEPFFTALWERSFPQTISARFFRLGTNVFCKSVLFSLREVLWKIWKISEIGLQKLENGVDEIVRRSARYCHVIWKNVVHHVSPMKQLNHNFFSQRLFCGEGSCSFWKNQMPISIVLYLCWSLFCRLPIYVGLSGVEKWAADGVETWRFIVSILNAISF